MAASRVCFDLEKKAFKTQTLEAIGMDISFLPRVAEDHCVVGHTPQGVPVIVSLGDNQASVLGSVQDLEDTVLINIGTGSQESVGTRHYVRTEGSVEMRPCTKDSYICVGSGLCGSRADAMLEAFYRKAAGSDQPQYGAMLRHARDFYERSGCEKAWKVRTTFSGTRDDPSEHGSIANIGVENFHPGAMTLGVIEGILAELYEGYEQIVRLTGRRARRLVGSGNGLRRNELMQRITQDIFGLALMIPAHHEEAVYEAALCAMACAGRVGSLRQAQQKIAYIGGDK